MRLNRRHKLMRRFVCWLYGHDPIRSLDYQPSPGKIVPASEAWYCWRCETTKVVR